MTRSFRLCFLITLFLVRIGQAQTGPATLRGQVMDQSGAAVPGAAVTAAMTTVDGHEVKRTTTSNAQGQYSLDELPAGTYLVEGSAAGLLTLEPVSVAVRTGVARLDVRLTVKRVEENVTVQENGAPGASTDSAANANSLVLRGEALDSLSDNPDDLQADLQALAGPSAGPSGGAIYVDGFSGGDIPPKNSIREIRLNQDPFSAEFDKLGYGRIEILTKPGSNKYHGTFDYNLGTDVWNSRNPFASEKAPLLLNEFEGGASGPLNKRASFTIDAQRNMVDNGSVSNGVVLDTQSLAAEPFNSVFKTVQRYTRATPRVDYQLSENRTLSLRYGITHGDINGAGIGTFDLISRGYHTTYTNQTVQATYNDVFGAALNETRFQYYRNANQMTANSTSPVLRVLGSFNGGGAQLGHSADAQDSFELQNYTSMQQGAHSLKFGVRLRALLDDNTSPLNFNGTYTFGGGLGPILDGANQPVANSVEQISSIERYRRTLLFERLGYPEAQIRALGGGASQFSISNGIPELSRRQIDAGLFAGDDWRVRPGLTVAYGLRYEVQTNVSDWRDVSPRLSFAWSPSSGGKQNRKTVLRAGFGIFYDRFALANTIAADRYNGVTQRQYVLTNPDTYPNIPLPSDLAQSRSPQTVQRLASDLRAPYVMQTAVTFERHLASTTTAAITYTNSRGLHLLRSRDINAPYPGTGIYPLGENKGPVQLIESSGRYSQNQMIANVNTRLNQGLSLFAFYVLNRALSDTDGVATSPANPYDFRGEYGAAATDVRQRFTLGGALTGRWNIRLSPFVILQSGYPFDITSGFDNFGTSVFNARPGFATDASKPGVVETKYGLLDPTPGLGEVIVPRNYGRGPAQLTVNLRISKAIGFGPQKEAARSSPSPQLTAGQSQAAATGGSGLGRLIGPATAARKYNLILGLSIRNLLNHTNPGPIIGDVTSPLFGRANQVFGTVNGEGFSENASNRRLEMQIRFTF